MSLLTILRKNIEDDTNTFSQYPNLAPPSILNRDKGFYKSPFSENVGQLTRFFKNKVFNPAYDYTTQNVINPLVDAGAEYFGYQSVSPDIVPKSKESNITGETILQNTVDTAKDVIPYINKVTRFPFMLLSPTEANQGEDEVIAELYKNYEPSSDPNLVGQMVAGMGLLSNEEIKNQTTAGLLNTEKKPPFPSTGITYDSNTTTNNNQVVSSSSDNAVTGGQTTNENQTTTDSQSVAKANVVDAPIVNDPSIEAIPVGSSNEVTPTGGFMDKLTNFATSEFGRDFFAELAKASGPRVGEPSSIGQNIGTAYTKAKKSQTDRINQKLANQKEPVFRGQLETPDGEKYSLFSSGGKTYVNTPRGKVFEKDFRNVFGPNYSLRTMGQQTFGILSGNDFQTLARTIDEAEISMTKYADYLQSIGDANVGIERLADGVTSMFKIALGGKLDQDELNLLSARGELQGLLGASRQQVVGGGVLTEQDALRILSYLGGDVTAFQSPERVKQAISKLLRDTYQTYETNIDFYNANVNAEYKSMGFERKDKNPLSKEQLAYFDPVVTSNMGKFDASYHTTSDLLAFLDNQDLGEEAIDAVIKELEIRKQ